MKKILVTNDDGVYAEGIGTLSRALRDAGCEVLVCAPDRERSASGHSMTMDRPLQIKRADAARTGGAEAWCCDGTPTDSVIMGLEVLKFPAEFVISGINCGPNLGDDITYSGTACAAMEGVIAGLPSMAVSLVCSSRDKILHYETAARAAVEILEWTKAYPMEPGLFYNVNVPNVPTGELRGVKLARKGKRRYHDKITVIKTPFGGEAYWVGGRIEDDMAEDTDVFAVAHGFASVTPVHLEMTSFAALEKISALDMEREVNAALGKN